VPFFAVILASWSMAFVEYCLAVPANRWGSTLYSMAQLKTIQEVITLVILPAIWNHVISFAMIAIGAFFVFRGPL
jgi:uncharacterized protein (DUF486 family)